MDVDHVRQMPVSRTGAKAERIWTGSEDGNFRVRDMYSLVLHNQIDSHCSTGNDPLWKKLWSLNIHPKAKIFLWRAL